MEWYEWGCWGWNSPKKENETPLITEEGIIEWSSQEFCSNEIDVIESETVNRIICLIEKKSWEIEAEDISTSASEIYERFMDSYPISIKERDYLIAFFSDEKVKFQAQKIVSKLNIIQWPENKKFIRSFLENEKWENDTSNPIRCILYNLENYPFVLNFEYDEIEEIQNDKIKWRKFIFEKEGKKGFVITNNDKIFTLPYDFFEDLTVLDNWLIFWNIEFSITDSSEKEKMWIFYQFTWEWFEKIKEFEWIKQVNIVTYNWDIFYKSDNWKLWLLWVNETKKWEKEELQIEWLLEPRFDIIKSKNWFIFGFTEKEEDENSWKLEIFTHDKAEQSHLSPSLENSISKALEIDNVPHDYFARKHKIIPYNFFDNWEYLSIYWPEWVNYYKVDVENKKIIPIEWLQWVDWTRNPVWHIFSSEKPVFVKYKNWEWAVMIYDKNTNSVKKLFVWDNIAWLGIGFYEDKKLLLLEWYRESCKWNRWSIYNYSFYIDWVIYIPKKWYRFKDIDRGYIYIEKVWWIFWIWKKQILWKNFEKFQEYLEPVKEYPILL